MSGIAAEICKAGRRLYARELILAAEGNISVRDRSGDIWITPAGASKGFMTPRSLIKVNINGEVIVGSGKPSTEIKMHLCVYKQRKDANAVVHIHPVIATAFASAGVALDKPYLTGNVLTLGVVPVAPYATPSTDEVAKSITPFLHNHKAILLANHGALCIGKTLDEAVNLAEYVETAAKTALVMRLLGAEDNFIPPEKVKQLSCSRAC